ncbi:MAG: phosphomannomutase/phosphoglucomutase [Clostridia bacterium]|nr:phosphomannomutase/phosphoglucomutase [Clostridia bacterium]
MMDYRKLQNGSDIRGVAMEGVAGEPVSLTGAAMADILRAFVLFLMDRLHKDRVSIAIGRDSRLSGPALLEAAAEAALDMGAEVCDFGLASTPAMFMSTVLEGFRYDGAVMLTASHLPFNRNGAKFFTREGGLEKADITAILIRAGEGAFPAAARRGQLARCDFLPVYGAHLAERVRRAVNAPDYARPLKGFHIVVDAGNGAGGFFVEHVLKPLGADTAGSQFLEPDGRFLNHAPNPEDAAAMDAAADCVIRNGADLGIIFDTDVDRAGAVAPDGRELNRNRLIALIAAILLEEHPGTAIVTDSITSSGLAAFIAERGGRHRRFKRGYRNVINEAIRLNAAGQDCQLAMETPGHGALKENYFLDDGAYLMVKLLSKMAQCRAEGRTLLSLIDALAEPKESVEVRMRLDAEDFAAYGAAVIEQLGAHAAAEGWAVAPDNFEGLRISFPPGEGAGWFLLRMSLHDPLMPLNIESDRQGGVKQIAEKLYAFLCRFDRLDTEGLKRLL